MKAILAIDDTAKERQATASEPRNSVWVGANAGSGKTTVLARRVIRLLLSGVNPEKILCLTFTKAAAAEMSERVFDELAKWAIMPDALLFRTISNLADKPPRDTELQEARRLFARALETPGGLKIQTIHAFCERLLHQFPMEANVAGHFEVLDDVAKEHLLAEAERDMLLEAAKKPGGEIASALSQAIAYASDTGYRKALQAIVARQRVISTWLSASGGVAGAVLSLRGFYNLNANATLAGLEEQMLSSPDFQAVYFEGLRQELQASSVKFQKMGKIAETILSHQPFSSRVVALKDFFFTQKGDPRKHASIASKEILEAFPDLAERIDREQERLCDLLDKQKALATLDATQALLTLGSCVAEGYTAKKAATGMMDFDDLIEKAASLLEKPDAAAWVHFKLDQGLDHILVDEAQDTSPRQWDVIKHLGDEFFTGMSARSTGRTLFAVGDEKQSIYSFQGASPEWFSRMKTHFKNQAQGASKPFCEVPLSLSFRSTKDILYAVDLVFKSPVVANKLTDNYVPHAAARQNQPGYVELWPPIAKPEEEDHKGAWWEPLDRLSEKSEKAQLADKIAGTIKTMLDGRKRLEGTGRQITAGNILILTRKRGAQVDAINRALKAQGIAVAGSDRLKLMDNIAVLDLLALSDFVLLSEDDLALAGLLKSPLIGLGEEALFELAHDRRGTVWNELFIRAQKGEAPYHAAYNILNRWRQEADFVPPYDFFLRVLSRDKGRQAFLSALGQETNEVIEAFLTEVQTFEQNEVPTLQGFVTWFRTGAVEIKRDMETARDEVRVMTVHGAKGLEAPIVFLVDGGVPYHASHQPEVLGLGEDGDAPFIWKRGEPHRTRAQEESLAREKADALAEYYRLLYVAMTRARDRLYVVTTGDKKGQTQVEGWFSTIFQALTNDENCTAHLDEAGNPVFWRWQVSEPVDLEVPEDKDTHTTPYKAPEWLLTEAPAPPPSHKTLTPSRAGSALDEDEPTGIGHGDNDLVGLLPMERGILMHRLLERLPTLSSNLWDQTANTYLENALPGLASGTRRKMIDEVINVLDNDPCHQLFYEGEARSEVPVDGNVMISGQTHRVRGEIDRLVITDDHVHIVDFKTNRDVPQHQAGVPKTYIRQLALYRAILTPLFPDRPIIASLLWTKGPHLMQLDQATLDHAFD